MATRGIYKSGQGYWVRMMSAIGYGLLLLMGLVWIWNLTLKFRFFEWEQIYVQMTAVILVGLVFGFLAYYLFGRKPAVVEFMIATEGEMKKVNWSSKRELWSSTKAVILLTLFIALACWVLDLGFARFFSWVDVLHEGA